MSFHPEQKLTIGETLYAYTQGSAYAEFAEGWKGKLAPGYVADFVVLDRDLTAIAPARNSGDARCCGRWWAENGVCEPVACSAVASGVRRRHARLASRCRRPLKIGGSPPGPDTIEGDTAHRRSLAWQLPLLDATPPPTKSPTWHWPTGGAKRFRSPSTRCPG